MSVAASVKLMVADRLAKIKGGEGVGTMRSNSLIRYWENISPEHIEACIAYLREYTSAKNGDTPSLSVIDLQVDKTVLAGYWRGGKVTVTREGDDARSKNPGKYTIYQELNEGFITTTRGEDAVSFAEWITADGHLYSSGISAVVLRLANVDPASVDKIQRELHANSTYIDPVCRYDTLSGTYYFEDARPKPAEDGSYSIELTMWSLPLNLTYTVVGRRKTAFVNEEQRLYEDIPRAYVTQLVNDLVVLGNYTLVDADARKTSDTGIFDVYLTLRTHVVPPGGVDIVIGGTGGLFKTQLRMVRNVADVDVEDTVNGLMQLSLIDNVRATGGREDGIWDVMYSLLIVPPPRSEIKKSEDRRQTGHDQSDYDEVEGVTLVATGYEVDESEDSGYRLTYTPHSHLVRLLQDYRVGHYNMTRTVTVSKTVSYSANYPGAVVGFGEVTQLSNGLWQKIVEDVDYDWWPVD